MEMAAATGLVEAGTEAEDVHGGAEV